MHANMKIKAIPGNKAGLGCSFGIIFVCLERKAFQKAGMVSSKSVDLLNTNSLFHLEKKGRMEETERHLKNQRPYE